MVIALDHFVPRCAAPPNLGSLRGRSAASEFAVPEICISMPPPVERHLLNPMW